MEKDIFPGATGELLTGRVRDATGDPVSGATVYATSGSVTVAGTTNGRGIYALLVSGGRPWTVIATDGDDAGSLTTFVAASVSAEFVRVPVGATVTDEPGIRKETDAEPKYNCSVVQGTGVPSSATTAIDPIVQSGPVVV